MWLEQQLLLARARGMQVWLTGHVPATKANWYGDCYTRFGELTLAFQDTIVGCGARVQSVRNALTSLFPLL